MEADSRRRITEHQARQNGTKLQPNVIFVKGVVTNGQFLSSRWIPAVEVAKGIKALNHKDTKAQKKH